MTTRRRLISRIAAGLRGSHAARLLVAEELASDFAALEAELVARGVPPAEARRRAAIHLDPSPDVLTELENLHRPLSRRLKDRCAEPRGWLELAVLALLALPLLGSYGAGLIGSGMMSGSSWFVWPVLGLCAAALAVAAVSGLSLLFGNRPAASPDRSRSRPDAVRDHPGIDLVLILPATAVLMALCGAVMDLWSVAGTIATAPEAVAGQEVSAHLLGWAVRSAGTMATALSAVLIFALFWLALSGYAARLRAAERALDTGRLPGEPPIELIESEAGA